MGRQGRLSTNIGRIFRRFMKKVVPKKREKVTRTVQREKQSLGLKRRCEGIKVGS